MDWDSWGLSCWRAALWKRAGSAGGAEDAHEPAGAPAAKKGPGHTALGAAQEGIFATGLVLVFALSTDRYSPPSATVTSTAVPVLGLMLQLRLLHFSSSSKGHRSQHSRPKATFESKALGAEEAAARPQPLASVSGCYISRAVRSAKQGGEAKRSQQITSVMLQNTDTPGVAFHPRHSLSIVAPPGCTSLCTWITSFELTPPDCSVPLANISIALQRSKLPCLKTFLQSLPPPSNPPATSVLIHCSPSCSALDTFSNVFCIVFCQSCLKLRVGNAIQTKAAAQKHLL